MMPNIGITSQIIRAEKWYKQIHHFGFRTVEINRQNSKLHFNLYFLEKVRRYTSGFDLSIHSATAGIFQPMPSFAEANLAVLKAEIDLCRFLGAKQLVFHLNDGILPAENKHRLKEVIDYAGHSGVAMCYESNCTMNSNDVFDVLETFTELGFVLDLGHLNVSAVKGRLGCSIETFMNRVKDRVVYIHANNNSGKRDEHKGLRDGSLNWRKILNGLNTDCIEKIIIEVCSWDYVDETRRDLMDYFGKASEEFMPEEPI
jgi:sugar phosphate isomerase/epimerase